MELRHFRVFSILAEELHFGRAAHRLNTAQPVISKTLRDIEDELGAKLIDRSTRQVELTPAGQAFLREVHETLYHAEKALRSARESSDVGVERLTLGLTIGAAQPEIGELVAAFQKKNPIAQVEIVAVDEANLGKVLSDGTVDAVVAWDRSIPKGLKSKEIMRVAMKVLVPEDHSLASKEAVPMSDLHGVPVILPARHQQPVLFETYRAYCAEQGIEPKHALDVTTTADLLAMVAGGAGVGHAPVPDGIAYKGISILPQTPPFELAFCLVWARQNMAVSSLLASIQKH